MLAQRRKTIAVEFSLTGQQERITRRVLALGA